MGKLSIIIQLLGRQYPVSVDERESAAVKQAADLVTERLAALRTTYGRQGDVDIALMCCLQLANDLVAARKQDDLEIAKAKKAASDLAKRLARTVEEAKV